MKNLPARATCQNIIDAVQASGYTGTFEFLFFPMKNHGVQNKGYAFVSFRSHREARSFQELLDGVRLREASGKGVSLEVARRRRPLEEIARKPQVMHHTRWGPIVVTLSQPQGDAERDIQGYEMFRGDTLSL
jgi:hypothetical protein